MIELDFDELRTWFGFGVAGNFAGQRPSTQPAIPSSRNADSNPISAVAPASCANTHTSQITVAKMGTAVACFSSSIHTPGFGSSFVHAG